MSQRDDYIDEHLDSKIAARIADMETWEILGMSIFYHNRQMTIREIVADELEDTVADDLGTEWDEENKGERER